jgi:predicted PurR-regulated permease PerM
VTQAPDGAPPAAPRGLDEAAVRRLEAAAWRVGTRWFLFAIATLVLLYLVVQLKGVVVQVLLAVIIAAGMTPVVNRASRRKPVGVGRYKWVPPRALIVLLLYLALLGALSALMAVLVPPLVQDVETLISRLPDYAVALQRELDALPERYPFLPRIDLQGGLAGQLRAGAAQAAAVLDQALVVVRVVAGVLGGVLDTVFVLILALYITVDGERILRYLTGFFPAARQPQAEAVAGRIGERLGGWLRGQVALSGIIGSITLVGLSAIGVPYAVLLALIAAVGEAIPLIGPIISAVPAVIVASFQSPLQGLLTLGLYVLVQQLENNLIVPKVMERAVALHPLAVMLALLAGAELLGVTGAILSVPVAAAVSVLVREVRLEQREREGRKQAAPPAPGGAAAVGGPAAPAGAPPAGAGLAAPDQAEHDPGAAGHHPDR